MIRIIPYKSYRPVTGFAVKEQLDSGYDGRTVFIVPESVKASVERLVFDELVKGRDPEDDRVTSAGSVSAGTLDTDVLSFVRLSHKILTLTGRKVSSDDILLRNVIYRVLTDSPSDFPNLNRLRHYFEYIDLLVDLVGDFRRYGIGPDGIREKIGLGAGSDAKLSEVALLIERIDKLGSEFDLPVNESLPDMATETVRSFMTGTAPRRFRELKSFLNSKFVVIGLGSSRNLTPQEINLIKVLSDAGAEVVVYAAAGSGEYDSKFSEFGENTISVMKSIGGKVECEPKIISDIPSNDINLISRHYAEGDMDYHIGRPDDGSIDLISLTMPDDAVSFIANEINRLVRVEEKYRFSDIRILCADDEYKDRIKCIFELFDLQMFIDKKVILLNTPVVRFVLGLLDVSLHDYDVSDVLKLLRTGVFTGVRNDLTGMFDNYLLRENIRDGRRLFDPDYYSLTLDSDSEKKVRKPFTILDEGTLIVDGGSYLYENIVKRVLVPMKEVTDAIDREKTISGKAVVLARYIGSLKGEVEALRDEYLKRNESDTALAIVQGYQEIMKLLSSFTGDLNNVPISREQFASLVRTDMKNKASGSIPLSADSVQITSIESSIYTPCKVLFIIGADSGNFPHSPSREGIISSDVLKSLGLPDKVQQRSRQETVAASLLLNGVDDKLYFITSSTEMPSSVFTYIRSALSYEGHEFQVKRGDYVTPVYGIPVNRRHIADDSQYTYITPEHMKTLLSHGREKCSVSSIEMYNGCPLHYMLDYALRIRVRKDGTRQESGELGLLCHKMFEDSMADVKAQLDTRSIDELISEATPERLKEMSDRLFREAIKEDQITNPEKYSSRYAVYPGLKARRIFESAYPVFLNYYKTTGYRPYDFEKKLESLDRKIDIKTTVKTKDNDDIEFDFKFVGSIDRVDKNPDNGNIRIVDYKTYLKSIDLKEAAEGVQIQLLAYAYGLEQEPGVHVQNAGYIKTYLPTKKKKPSESGPFEYIAYDTEKYKFDEIKAHAYKKLQEACTNISEGKSAVRLTSSEFDNACTFCSFKGACGRKPDKNKPDAAPAKELAESWKIEQKKGKKGKK